MNPDLRKLAEIIARLALEELKRQRERQQQPSKG